MDRPIRIPAPAVSAIGLAAGLVLAACTGAGASSPPASPSPGETAMEHSPTPSAPASASPSGPVSTGRLHAVDGTASGTVALFHRPDGSFVITFEDFSIDSAAHTNVILVTNQDVTRDGDVDRATLVDLGPLKGTSGMQDFPVPASADAMTYHTVVIWDTEMAHAIAAAPLR